MPTNLAIDDRLLNEVVREGKHRTKREAVNAALSEYLKHLKRMKAIELIGTIDFHDDVDVPRSRRKRRSA
jgi:Arc/MetJ family transcription regulator